MFQSSQFEENVEYLRLFHFVVRIIGEESSYLDMYRDSLALILQDRIKKTILSIKENKFEINEKTFITTPLYRNIVKSIATKVQSIVDMVKNQNLWVNQGFLELGDDQIGILTALKSVDCVKIEELKIIRGLSHEIIMFDPCLPLYHEILIKGTLSEDPFIRLFSASLLIEAPTLPDAHQYSTVLSKFYSFWNRDSLSFEFFYSAYEFIKQLCPLLRSVLDDKVNDQIISTIKSMISSKSFDSLYMFDKSLGYFIDYLPFEVISDIYMISNQRVIAQSYSHMCLSLRILRTGLFSVDSFLSVFKHTANSINKWPESVIIEFEEQFPHIASLLSTKNRSNVLDTISDIMLTETVIFIFKRFLIYVFLDNSVLFHEKLFINLEKYYLIHHNSDILEIFAFILKNPLRLLHSLIFYPNSSIYVMLSPYISNQLFDVVFSRERSILYSKEAVITSTEKIVNRLLRAESIDWIQDHIQLSLNVLLFPICINSVISKFNIFPLEEMRTMVYATLASLCSNYKLNDLDSIRKGLPIPAYLCEYSHYINVIREVSTESTLPSDRVTNICSALLFENIIYKNGGSELASFNRLRIHPSIWYSSLCSSSFSSCFKKENKSQFTNNLSLVSMAVFIHKKIHSRWIDLIVEEDYENIVEYVLFPHCLEPLSEREIHFIEKNTLEIEPEALKISNVLKCYQ